MFLGRFRNFQHFLVSATGATPATLAIIITAIDIQFQIFHPPQTRNLIKAIFWAGQLQSCNIAAPL